MAYGCGSCVIIKLLSYGSIAQIGRWPQFPFPRTDLSQSFRDEYAKRGVPRYGPLAEQFNTMHLRLDATPAVVSVPSSPEGSADVFRCPHGFVSRGGTGGDGLPKLCVLARRDDSVGAAIRDGIVASASVLGAIRGDAADLLVRRDLIEKIGQNRCIANVAPGDLNSPDFQFCSIDPEVDLAPDPPFRATMLAGVPLAFALDLDARAVDEQVQRPFDPR